MNINDEAIRLHKQLKGKISVVPKKEIKNREDLSLVYTPGVAAVSRLLAAQPGLVYDYTIKGNTVAVVSDGSAVLGLGNVGPEAALPVMEGKCAIFKQFAGIDAFPIVLSTQDPQKIIEAVVAIAPSFGGINLEDISAPNCFIIEEELKKRLSIPVIHDDQWGAAIAVLAGLFNALKLAEKGVSTAKIVILGAGAAGSATAKLLFEAGARNMIMCDSTGIIYDGRDEDVYKQRLAKITNLKKQKGSLTDAIKNADVFIGLSKANILSVEMVRSMNEKPIVFGLANPDPEITYEDAQKAGVFIYASGRSDLPNQINNALIYPGLFRGVLDNRLSSIEISLMVTIAEAVASNVRFPQCDKIVPSVFETGIVEYIAEKIRKNMSLSH